MTVQNIVAFPGRDRDFESWISWVECELSILGFAISSHEYEWRAAYEKGLQPRQAAEEAASTFEAS